MSTISTTINHGVILGQPGYYTPLTVTSTGAVNNNGTGKGIFGGNATVVNYGRITATGSSGGYGYQGVYLGGGYVNNHGTITASGNAVLLQGAGTVVNSGFIYGHRWGITSRGLVSVTNTGTISGYSEGVVLSAGGLITNNGLIGGSDGLGIGGAAGTVVNSGNIVGTYGAAVNLSGGGTVINTGTGLISNGGLYAGVTISGGAGSVVNSGTIDSYFGVEFSGAYNNTVADSGTIIGTGGGAVGFGSGNDLLLFQPSSSAFIQGTVDGGGGTNTLEFGTGGGTLTGQGADFVNFGQGTVDAGGPWSIDGNVTLGAGIDLTLLGNLVVAGTLENAGTISQVGYLQLAAGGYLRNDASGTIVNDTAHSFFDPAVSAPNGGDVTIVNFGAIEDPAGNASIYLTAGGTVVNGSATDTSALIRGLEGLYAYQGRATVTNFGSIIGFSNQGIGLAMISGGVVTNGAAGSTSAVVSGAGYGIFMPQGIGTVVNFGTISSTRYGIQMGGGTVVDAGLIVGGSDALKFTGADDLLILEHGFTLTGAIAGFGSGNVVELQGSAGAAVAATYNALGLSNFQTAAFAPGDSNYATWTITNDAALPGTIAGFTGIHDAIDLTQLSDANNDATTSFNSLTNVLTVTGDNGSVQLQLDSENYTGNAWAARNDGSNGTEVVPLCFCAGTAIATPGGEVPVERLAVGDLVATLSGQARTIAWIGAGRVLATRGRRNAATPVIVRKGALGADVPYRDLHVTKGHSLYLDGVLIPVEFLVNHRSILWDDHAQEVTLYHIELETHDVLLANGAPAESYRDDGNRWLFQNANAGWDLPPKPTCAEVLTGGPIVDAVWRRLLDRAGPCPRTPLENDPDLHLLVDGCRLDAVRRVGAAYIFSLPATADCVRVVSRAAAPVELGLARDPRVLGIALWRIAVRSGGHFRIVDMTDDRLVEGFHGYEADGDRRWTNGDALLPAALFDGFARPAELVLHVEGTTQYRADARSRPVAA